MSDSAPAPGSTTDQSAPELSTVVRYYIAIFRQKWKWIAISVSTFIALAIVYLLLTPRKYEATARILIIQQGGRPLAMANNETSGLAELNEDYVPTHALIVSSPLVVGRAINSLGLENLPTLQEFKKSDRDPLEGAIDLLRVDRPDRMAKVLRLTYKANSKAEAIKTLGAIIQSYEVFLTVSLTKNNNDIVRMIARAKDELSVELADMEKKYLQFRQNKQVMLTDEKGRSFISMQLEQLYRAANEAKIKAVTLKQQLELGKKLADEGRGLWAIAHSMEQLGQASAASNSMTSMAVNNQNVPQDYIRMLTTEQQQLADKFGPTNAKVQEIKEQIDRVQEGARESRKRLDKVEVEDLIAAVEQGSKSIEAMYSSLQKEFDDSLAEAKRVETDVMTDSNYRANMERQRLLFNTVVDQLKQAQFVGDYSSFTSQTIEQPSWHFGAVSPRLSVTLAIAMMIGGIIGLGGAVLVDRMDPTLHSASEVKKSLGIAVVGQIQKMPEARPDLAIGQSKRTARVKFVRLANTVWNRSTAFMRRILGMHDVRPLQNLSEICHIPPGGAALVADTLPRSSWAEAYRGARTNLQLFHRSRQVQVVLVTSPWSGDGKSTTVSNLAISLAHSGRTVLLIDADLRNPSQDKLHGIVSDQGLVHILKDGLAADQVIRKTSIEHLDVIPAGPVPSNPAELLSSPRLSELLTQMRRSYDFVLVDSSPLLEVTDPTILGSFVDGVLLVLRAPAIHRRDAEQALDLLGTLGLPIVGTFLNGVAHDHAGFQYAADRVVELNARELGLSGDLGASDDLSLTYSSNGDGSDHSDSPTS